MPNRFASVLIACLLGSAPAAALAQPAPSSTVAPVTVKGVAEPRMIESQSRSFVQSYAAAPNAEIDQIGRWHEAVCVEVVGLPRADQAAVIKARVESVAQAVGLPAARADCRANVEIVFTDRPQHVMDMVAKRREYLLGYYHRHETNRLKTVTHPIQAWYVTATRGGAGDVASMVFANIESVTGPAPAWRFQPHQEVIDDPDNPPPLVAVTYQAWMGWVTVLSRLVSWR